MGIATIIAIAVVTAVYAEPDEVILSQADIAGVPEDSTMSASTESTYPDSLITTTYESEGLESKSKTPVDMGEAAYTSTEKIIIEDSVSLAETSLYESTSEATEAISTTEELSTISIDNAGAEVIVLPDEIDGFPYLDETTVAAVNLEDPDPLSDALSEEYWREFLRSNSMITATTQGEGTTNGIPGTVHVGVFSLMWLVFNS